MKFLMRKGSTNWHWTIFSIVSFVSIAVAGQTTSAQLIPTQVTCTSESSSIRPQAYFWGLAGLIHVSNSAQALPSNARNLSVGTMLPESVDLNTQIMGPQISQDGSALAYFVAGKSLVTNVIQTALFHMISLNVITKTGRHLLIPASQNWAELGPELSPGHFGMLAGDANKGAQLWDVDWSGDHLKVSLIKQLPFLMDSALYVFQDWISIAPDWSAIAYTVGRASQPYSLNNNFQIYSLSSSKVIWDVPDILDKYPQVIWGLTSQILVVVNFGLADGDGKLIAISPSGSVSVLTDLSTYLGLVVRSDRFKRYWLYL